MAYNDRIRDARVAKKMTQKELAKAIGVGATTITGYEKGNSEPSVYILNEIMRTLDVDANYIFQDEMDAMGGSPMTLKYDEMEHIKKYRTLDTYGKDAVDSVLDIEYTRCQVKEESSSYIPDNIRPIDYYMKNASAGNGQIVFDDTVVERITIPDIPKYKRVAYAIGVNGNSMEPLYYDGDMLLIEPTVDMEIGEIGIFIVDGEAYVKKLGDKELISLNEDYSNIPLTEYTSCMGRVVDRLPYEK